MAARLIRIHTDSERLSSVLAAFEDEGLDPRMLVGSKEALIVEALVPPAKVDRVLARLRMVLAPGDLAVLLTPEWSYPDQGEAERTPLEELEARLESGTRLSRTYLLLTLLSAVVAFFGLVRDDPVLLVASMITAPLMTPLVALAFGSSWRDVRLIRRAAVAAAFGFGVALALGWLLGRLVPGSITGAMAVRSAPNPADLVLALSAGTMAALSFVSGRAEALIGVMVAIALLPPAVNAGVLLAWRYPAAALGALLLLLVNAAAILLASSLTFAVAFRFSFRKALLPALAWFLLAALLYWLRRAGG